MIKWVYATSDDDNCRFTLGELGNRYLVCVGLNPSKAKPGGPKDFDPTMKRVKKRAKSLGYDGYIMINLYPQRATNPVNMHDDEHYDENIAVENYAAISEVFALEHFDVWAAWGANIDDAKRRFLRDCLLSIHDVFQNRSGDPEAKWYYAGDLTKSGHPRHPLYIADSVCMSEFDVYRYAQGLKA